MSPKKNESGLTVLRNEKTGMQVHVEADSELAKLLAEQKDAVEVEAVSEDGFRPRKRRTKADTQRLIKEGVIREPGQPKPMLNMGENATVFGVPTASMSGKVER